MRLTSILEASHFSFVGQAWVLSMFAFSSSLCDRYALSAQTSDEVLSVVTNRGSIRPSAWDADVVALSRMKPKRRSIAMWDL
jgi:hypothetical protein